MDRHTTLVGLHIPKCAGTTFLENVRASLPPHKYYQNTSMIRNWQEDRPEFQEINNYHQLRLVWGHNVHEGMFQHLLNPCFFVVFRDPIERLISEACFTKRLWDSQGKVFDTADWLSRQSNPMCKFIIQRFPRTCGQSGTLSERASRILPLASHIIMTTEFAEQIQPIWNLLEIEPEIERANHARSETPNLEINNEQHGEDIKLFQLASELAGEQNGDLSSLVKSDAPLDRAMQAFLERQQIQHYKNWNVLPEVLRSASKKAAFSARLVQQGMA